MSFCSSADVSRAVDWFVGAIDVVDEAAVFCAIAAEVVQNERNSAAAQYRVWLSFFTRVDPFDAAISHAILVFLHGFWWTGCKFFFARRPGSCFAMFCKSCRVIV